MVRKNLYYSYCQQIRLCLCGALSGQKRCCSPRIALNPNLVEEPSCVHHISESHLEDPDNSNSPYVHAIGRAVHDAGTQARAYLEAGASLDEIVRDLMNSKLWMGQDRSPQYHSHLRAENATCPPVYSVGLNTFNPA
jgi:hypothetical protein